MLTKHQISMAFFVMVFQLNPLLTFGNPGVKKPNVIILLTDQWRAQDLGYMGNDQVATPNIDLLATESVNVSHAVSGTPVCSPYRASLLTGQYPLTHGVFYNDKPLSDEAVTMGEIFKNAGYATAYIGKWHLNGDARGPSYVPSRMRPVPEGKRQGFDFWRVNECTHNYNNSFYYDEQDVKHFWKGYDAFDQADVAIDYIENHSTASSPFLMILSVGPPHAPYQTAPEKYRELYPNPEDIKLRPNVPEAFRTKARESIAGYYAHIAAMDEVVKKLQKSMKTSGIEDNTIFIFTADHGDMLYSHGFQKKQQPYEESIRIPFLIKYPNHLKKFNRNLQLPLNAPDVLPTLLGLCGMDIPKSVEGKDFSKVLKSHKTEVDEPALISCQIPFHQWTYANGGREYRGLKTNRYTYVEDLDGPWLFYDNAKDPYQMNNLVGKESYEKEQARLHDTLWKMLHERNDDFRHGDFYMQKWGYSYNEKDSLISKSKTSHIRN